MNKLRVFTGGASLELGDKIGEYLGIDIGNLSRVRFADGEIWIKFNENIRGMDVFLIQSLYAPAENLLELLFMIDAAKRASAKRVTAVIPYFGYARQDRKDQPRVSISARVIADLLESVGVDRVVCMDLHAAQIQGFFSVPVDHLYASFLFVDYFKELNLKNMKLVAPDIGAVKMAGYYAKHMDAELVVVDKRRPQPNVAYVQNIIGDVKDRNMVILDDLIDTAGSMCAAAEALKTNGAKDIYACCSHALLSRDAVQRIEESKIKDLIITDTIPLSPEKNSDKIKVISTASMVGEAIKRIHFEQSISSLFV